MIRMTPWLFVLAWTGWLVSGTVADDAGALAYDFADAAQRDDFKEAPTAGVQRYPHSADTGVGIQSGRLDAANRGEQGQTLHLTKRTFDLTAQPLAMSMKFQHGPGEGDPGATRILLVVSKGVQENLVSGMGKVGVRVFRPDSPGDAAAPWRLQLVNGISTRDIGAPFALQPGHWYELGCTLGATSDGKTLSFHLGLRDMGKDGSTPGELQRSGSGKTPASTHYDVRKAMLGILTQNVGDGAVALDDIMAEPVADVNAKAPPPPPLPDMETVLFPPRPVPADRQAPPRSLFGTVGHVMHTASYYGPDSGKGEAWSLPQTLPWLMDARLGWVREGMYQPWFANTERKDVAKHRADFEASLAMYQKHGVRVVLCILAVSPGDQWVKYNEAFFDYVAELVRRFECVRVVEMHNEPNLKFFWRGTAEDYAATYAPAAARMKAARADVQVAMGSISSLWWEPGVTWLETAIAAGALQWADAITVHPYNRNSPPEMDPHFPAASAAPHDHREQAVEAWWSRVTAKAPDAKLSLHLTELGYSSAGEGIAGLNDEVLQADYLSRLMMIYLDLRLRGLPLESVHWYDLKDDGPREELGEHNFGLIEHDLSRAKPAYHAYAAVAAAFDDAQGLSKLDLGATFNNWPEAIKHYVWQTADGTLIVPFWRLDQVQGEGRDVDFNAVLTLTLPANWAPESVALAEAGPAAAREVGFTTQEGRIVVPVHVRRHAQWLTIRPSR